MVSTVEHQLPLSSSRGDNSSPYIGLWLEGYPASTLDVRSEQSNGLPVYGYGRVSTE